MAAGKRLNGVLLACIFLVLSGCAPGQMRPTPSTPTATVPPTAPTSSPTFIPTITPTDPPPFLTAWQSSGHANPDSPAFRYWDDSEAALLPVDCARCHSSMGFLDYLGADGSQPGVVEAPVEPGSVLECETCHDKAAEVLDSASMPSGIELTGLGRDAVCVACHQGLSSGSELALAVKSLAQNGITPALEFVIIHYQPAGAVLFGGEAGAGFEFPGRAYAGRFDHIPGESACTGCHDAHELDVQIDACAGCHPGADSLPALRSTLRVSTIDYDADGDTSEGIALEIETFRGKLLSAMQTYAGRSGNPLLYDAEQEPFFFTPDGEVYRAWTPILLEAAYNFHLAAMDPAAFAHNPRYMLQLLYDSIMIVGGDLTGLIRP